MPVIFSMKLLSRNSLVSDVKSCKLSIFNICLNSKRNVDVVLIKYSVKDRKNAF